MADVGIKLQGDWRRLRSKFERYTYAGEHMAEVTMTELADYTKEMLHEVVNSEPPPRNKPRTITNKGFDAPMLETGGFMENDSIVVLKIQVRESPYLVYKVVPIRYMSEANVLMSLYLVRIVQGSPRIEYQREIC